MIRLIPGGLSSDQTQALLCLLSHLAKANDSRDITRDTKFLSQDHIGGQAYSWDFKNNDNSNDDGIPL